MSARRQNPGEQANALTEATALHCARLRTGLDCTASWTRSMGLVEVLVIDVPSEPPQRLKATDVLPSGWFERLDAIMALAGAQRT